MLTELRAPKSEECLSDLVFDRWRAGELAGAELEAAEAHLVACARCAERKGAFDGEAAAFLGEFPRLAARPAEPSRAFPPMKKVARRWSTLSYAGGAALAAAAAVSLFIGVRAVNGPTLSEGDGGSGTRLKGSERIGFFVRRGEHVFEGAEGQRVQPGDQLRFAATTASQRELAILSLDAAGTASVYYPEASSRSRSLGVQRNETLEGAVELDETLGKERLFGVFCAAPFELEPLRRKLERDGRLPALPGCRVDVLEIVKEPPR